ncbi:tetratricopeptide repeat protein, partial [bacterium]|nr:tetratricopeptide repeat protein [bacterium]
PMHNTLGAVLGSRGDMEGAAREFTAALDESPNDLSARYNLGLALLELGNPAEAAAHLERATIMHPGYHEAWLSLARAYFELDRLADAHDAAQRVIDAEPTAPPELRAVAEAAQQRIAATQQTEQ